MSPRKELAIPEVLDDDGEPISPLDPCPSCGARPHDAPEGVDLEGKPHWHANYCFKCGYRPDSENVNPLSQRWNDFQRFTETNLGQHPTLQEPQDAEAFRQMQEGFAQMQRDLEELRTGVRPEPEGEGGS